MLLGTDELTILRGSKFYGTWQWVNSVTGDPEDFSGLTATVRIKNIHEDFEDIVNTWEVGTAIVEPLDIDNNIYPGRVDIELSKTETLYFSIPESENDRYGESDFYSMLNITLSTGEVILQAKVRVVESLEGETLKFLIDERGEAIIINQKLDDILLANDNFTTQRDIYLQTLNEAQIEINLDKQNIELSKINASESALTATTKAIEASTSAATATTKASEASISATTATTKATIATTKASEASTSAATAATKASEASTSAATAATKASEASISATTATTKANEASELATTATTKAGEASGSATTATTKANEASLSATIATTKAGEASSSAATATTKASEASASKNSASTSEENALLYKNQAKGFRDEIDPSLILQKITMNQVLNLIGV